MGRPQLALFAVAVAATLVAPRPARAQSAEDKAAAEAAFEEGKRLMSAHAFADACPKFAESNRRDPGIGAMLGLADCYEKNGQTASAWAEFREAAAAAGRKGDKREAVARENAARVEQLLSKILVRVPPEAETQGLVVKRDGVELGRALWDDAIPVDPGVHAVSAGAPGFKEWQVSVLAPPSPGVQTVTVPRLEAAPEPPVGASPSGVSFPSASTAATPHGLGTYRIIGAVAAGAGVVGLIVGGALGLVAKSKLDQSNANGHCDASDACDAAGLMLRQNAESAATGATVSFVAGGVLLVGGAVLWFTAPRAQSAHVGLAPSPGGFSVVGRW